MFLSITFDTILRVSTIIGTIFRSFHLLQSGYLIFKRIVYVIFLTFLLNYLYAIISYKTSGLLCPPLLGLIYCAQTPGLFELGNAIGFCKSPIKKFPVVYSYTMFYLSLTLSFHIVANAGLLQKAWQHFISP